MSLNDLKIKLHAIFESCDKPVFEDVVPLAPVAQEEIPVQTTPATPQQKPEEVASQPSAPETLQDYQGKYKIGKVEGKYKVFDKETGKIELDSFTPDTLNNDLKNNISVEERVKIMGEIDKVNPTSTVVPTEPVQPSEIKTVEPEATPA